MKLTCVDCRIQASFRVKYGDNLPRCKKCAERYGNNFEGAFLKNDSGQFMFAIYASPGTNRAHYITVSQSTNREGEFEAWNEADTSRWFICDAETIDAQLRRKGFYPMNIDANAYAAQFA